MPKRHMITPKQEQVKKTSAEMPCLLKKANFVTLHLIILILSGLFCPQLCYGVDRSIYFFILLFFSEKKITFLTSNLVHFIIIPIVIDVLSIITVVITWAHYCYHYR